MKDKKMWNKLFFNMNSFVSDKDSKNFSHNKNHLNQKKLLPYNQMNSSSIPRILIIDDDESFLLTIDRAAKIKGSKTFCCKTLDDLNSIKVTDYDVIIMDFNFGFVNGYELINYLEDFTKEEIPVILVSETKQTDIKKWPQSIRKFVHKELGIFKILNVAFDTYQKR
jgi:CheY-like chemotaxis protein